MDFGLAKEMTFAYNVLASRRTSGMAPNPIQLSEILAFMELYGRPSISIDVFVELLGVMDTKYLELKSGDRPSSNS